MSSNHHVPDHAPGSECARVGMLLPLLVEPGSDRAATEAVRAHASACAHCRAELAAYDHLDSALRSRFGPAATPRLSTADILWSIGASPAEQMEQIMEDTTQTPPPETTTPATDHARAFAPLPDIYNDRGPHGPRRRLISLAAALAAVLAIGMLAQVLFSGRVHITQPAAHTQTPAAAIASPPRDSQLDDILMVSPTEGWASGTNSLLAGASGAPGDLWHFSDNRWAPYPLDDSCTCIFEIRTLSLVSPTDIWAAGDRGTLLRYDGHTWQRMPPTGMGIVTLDMLSATHGWALLQNGDVVEYRSGAWTAVSLPTVAGLGSGYTLQIRSLDMQAGDAGWLAGLASNNSLPEAVIFHEIAGHWQLARTIPNADLLSIAMVSADEGWAVGSIQHTTTFPTYPGLPPSTGTYPVPLLLHYVDGTWLQAPNPAFGLDFQQSGLEHLMMVSPNEGWVVATSDSIHIYQPGSAAVTSELLHYHNGQWTEVRLPPVSGRDSIQVLQLGGTASGGLWVVGASTLRTPALGSSADGSYSFTFAPLILHDLNGAWTIVAS